MGLNYTTRCSPWSLSKRDLSWGLSGRRPSGAFTGVRFGNPLPREGYVGNPQLTTALLSFENCIRRFGVSARELCEQHWGAAESPGSAIGGLGNVVAGSISTTAGSQPSNSQERLGVVIIALNGQEELLRALRALLPQCEVMIEVAYQVVVVNNASTGGVLEAVRREFPQVTVIGSKSHGGLACGLNLGLRHLGFPNFVLVMDGDVEFSAGALAGMVGYLREHPSTAGVVASLTNPGGIVRSQRIDVLELVPRRPRRSQEVTFVSTACALVRGKVFLNVGLYDERFDSCQEDIDWSIRARRRGYGFVYLPDARVVLHSALNSRRSQPGVVAERLVAKSPSRVQTCRPPMGRGCLLATAVFGEMVCFSMAKRRPGPASAQRDHGSVGRSLSQVPQGEPAATTSGARMTLGPYGCGDRVRRTTT